MPGRHINRLLEVPKFHCIAARGTGKVQAVSVERSTRVLKRASVCSGTTGEQLASSFCGLSN